MTATITFAATFLLVFALAFQSLNTNRGHYTAAFLTSFLIGGMQLYALKIIPLNTSAAIDAAYLLGGPFGAIAAMWAHPKIMRRWKR